MDDKAQAKSGASDQPVASADTPSDSVDKTLPELAPGDHLREVQVDGKTRTYQVHVPPVKNDSGPWAVVMVFHGGGTNANWLTRFCGLTEKADEAGFLVAFPHGTGLRARRLSWNCGPRSGFERWVGGAGSEEAERNAVDEIAFVCGILDDLATVDQIDPSRVYACGISTGAIMCYYLASRLGDRIAAIAPVGGPVGEDNCHPSRPVPIIHFHGTEDEFAPYDGGPGSKSFTGVDFYSVDYTMQVWVKANRCEPEPDVTILPAQTDNGTSVTLSHWRAGKEGAEIKLYTIVGGGHTWPGRDPRMDYMGRYTWDINANDLIWEFFQEHPLPR